MRTKAIRYTINAGLFALGVYTSICAYNDIERYQNKKYNSCVNVEGADYSTECACFTKYPLADRKTSKLSK